MSQPLSLESKKYWIALNMLPDIGRIRFRRLLEYFGSAEKAFFAPLKEISKVEGIGKKIGEKMAREREKMDLEKEFALMDRDQVKVLTWEDEIYPPRLKAIYDPPPVLYLKGEIVPEDRFAVALVGSRRATTYGKLTTERLSGELVQRGLTVVSGMARGIDTAAHRGALNKEGRTIAVLGSGIGRPYPAENKGLMGKISESGAVISEFSMSTAPDRLNFPLRNRIISGLSLGVVVVEAAERSGALITADYALEQGREVFAVPGNVNARSTKGTHNLIRMGAKLVEKSADIVEELEPQLDGLPGEGREGPEKRLPLLEGEEKKVYDLLSEEPQHIDEIIRKTRISVTRMPGVLLTLEIKDLIKQLSGKMFVRK